MNDGTQLAQYRILGKLGEGGMGQVYRAEDTRLKREVAIKVLPADLADDPDRLARLEREARVLARLDHPNIAAIYGIEEAVPRSPTGSVTDADGDGGRASVSGHRADAAAPVRFLVMQLAEGETLDDLLDRRGGAPNATKSRTAAVTAVPSPRAEQPDDAALRYRGLPLEETLPIASAVAGALEAAHAQGIIHRDLKPANVKVALDHGKPRVKVLDFGLAKVYLAEGDDPVTDPSASPTMMAATQAGLIMGTAGYMSPEQARGQRVDQRADIWAFGVLLYEMLTGRRLFQGETISDTLAAVLKDDIDLQALPEHTPLPVRRLLRRCLHRDPRRRLHHIADALLEIEEASDGVLGNDADDIETLAGLAGDHGVAGATPVVAASRGLTWRHATAGALLILVGAAVGRLATPAATPSEAAVRVYSDLGPSDARSAVIAPDGNRAAVFIGDQLWVRDFDALAVRVVEGSEDLRFRPFWSPDSERLAFFGRDGLYVASADDGSSRRLDYSLRSSGSATWGPEGIVVSVAGRGADSAAGGGELILIDPDGSEERVVARSPGPGRLSNPTLLPDGETLVYEYGARRDGVFVYGTLLVQHGLTPGSPVETVLQRDDRFARLQYVESLDLLLAESLYTGIWSIPLARDGTVTGVPERLLPNGEDMSISDNGTLVYRALENRLETEPFRWIDRDGDATEVIPSGKREPLWLALSPDDTQVTFTAPRAPSQPYDIWVLDLVRGAETRITADPGTGDMPAWRGNDTLVFTSRSLRGAATSLLTQAASGAGSPTMIAEGGLFRSPAGSADGRFVVFEALTADGALRRLRPGGARGGGETATSTERDGETVAGSSPQGGTATGDRGGAPRGNAQTAAERSSWSIYYVDETNGPPQPYRISEDNETRPAPSPDGTLLAYVSDTSGANEVWVDTFPQASEPVRISVSGGGNARWSGSGDEIIYDDGADTLWSVRVDTRAAHGRAKYGDPERLFGQSDAATRFTSLGTRSWDVGRDGDAILTIQRYPEGITYVNVIENFPRWYLENR